ncbi:MAG: sigma-70 family RNA polymerase sigma factor [Acidobacteria bacterium]|nr:sigma-70 family RNA polymerase sigma factor [Acidobacteriota bacterium]
MEASGEITRLLSLWAEGDESALDRLMPLAYQELRQIAQYHWNRQPPGHTLQPTALIHEAWLKLAGQDGRSFQNRKQFFVLASMAMRQVLVNHAEARLAQKRGGGARQVSVDENDLAVEREADQVLAVHQALKSLQAADARKCRVVELRYFGGLSIEETAEALGVSPVTVTRDWQSARAWLARELGMGKS